MSAAAAWNPAVGSGAGGGCCTLGPWGPRCDVFCSGWPVDARSPPMGRGMWGEGPVAAGGRSVGDGALLDVAGDISPPDTGEPPSTTCNHQVSVGCGWVGWGVYGRSILTDEISVSA